MQQKNICLGEFFDCEKIDALKDFNGFLRFDSEFVSNLFRPPQNKDNL
jgi:hypothetical protein